LGFFVRMPTAYFRSKIGDHLDTVHLVRHAALQRNLTLADCAPLRADL
jgi:hypothetical protein